jgi:hypothetical protein
MSNVVLIIGQSGTGKSTSIRTLDPKSTFIISVLDKPLPFRSARAGYKLLTSNKDKEGNYYISDQWNNILKAIEFVNKERKDITTLVIDDIQYLMANEFMRRALEKGYDRFSEIAQHFWLVINSLLNTRSDLTCFVLCHSDTDIHGVARCKTIGKLLDEKITIEGMFTTILHSRVMDGQYRFQTQFDGDRLAKSPIDMFQELLIPNDLNEVKHAVESYYEEEHKDGV